SSVGHISVPLPKWPIVLNMLQQEPQVHIGEFVIPIVCWLHIASDKFTRWNNVVGVVFQQSLCFFGIYLTCTFNNYLAFLRGKQFHILLLIKTPTLGAIPLSPLPTP